MEKYDKIDFQYRKFISSKASNYLGLGIIISFIIMVVRTPIVGGIILLIIVIIGNLFLNSGKNLKGSFYLGDDDFIFKTSSKEQKINYSDVWLIIKEMWEESKSTFGISYTTPNGNQYTILLKNNDKYVFRVSAQEEKKFWKSMENFTKKVYGINSLGVSLNTTKNRLSEEEEIAKEKEFEKSKPIANYSLVNAINALIERGNLLFEDRTII